MTPGALADLVPAGAAHAAAFHSAPPTQGRYLRSRLLAPGVWVGRFRPWLPISALDRNADLPPPELPEAPPRRWEPPAWHAEARCHGLALAAFFGNDAVQPTMKRSEVTAAQRICAGCVAKVDCLRHALTKPEKFGVWGGASGRAREAMRERIKEGEDVEVVITDWVLKWLTK